MPPSHLHKFSDFFEKYDLDAVKNLWLLAYLLPTARKVSLNKLKDHVGGILRKTDVEPSSHCDFVIQMQQKYQRSKVLYLNFFAFNPTFHHDSFGG